MGMYVDTYDIQLTATSDYLAEEILKIGGGEKFELLSEINGAGLPLVAWKLKSAGKYDGTLKIYFPSRQFV